MVDFYDVEGVVSGLCQSIGVALDGVDEKELPSFLHPGTASWCVVQGERIGYFGMIHPEVIRLYELPVPVGFFELDVERLAQMAGARRIRFSPLPRYPGIRRDISLLLDADVPAERVAATIRATGGPWLKGVTIFDVYTGEAVGIGRKSLAYALYYQEAERTLTDDEVNGAHREILKRLETVFQATIRQ